MLTPNPSFARNKRMYQLEVKRNLIGLFFRPAAGWDVTIDVDAMELGKGGQQPPGKAERAARARAELEGLGAKIGAHDVYGRVDVVAQHPQHGLRLVEVEGDSSRQAEQAIYSCLGQLILIMRIWSPHTRYGWRCPIAVGGGANSRRSRAMSVNGCTWTCIWSVLRRECLLKLRGDPKMG